MVGTMIGTQIQVRVSDELLAGLDEIRGDLTRAEVLRRAGERVVAGERAKRARHEVDPRPKR